MGDIVIKAEGLGKKYVIGHQAENGRYVALRDVLTHNARKMWQTTKDLMRGAAIVQGDNLEEVWALRDVNFEIHQGDVVGIIGRNGSGKSTLLKILSRITEPTEGRVGVRGRVSSLLEVGTGFHPELTGRENIFLNGAILGMTRAEIKRKFDEIVAFAEIEKFLDTPVKRYSSGMYVRLAFAVAAHLEPEILIVDEVLAVGDAAFQDKCLGKMNTVARSGRTVLFVSHDMKAVEGLCQLGLLLDQGGLVSRGEIRRVAAEYLCIHNGNREIYQVLSARLKWAGLYQPEGLPVIGSNEPLTLQFRFKVGDMPVSHLEVDCVLTNQTGHYIVHARSKYVSRPFNLEARSDVSVKYLFEPMNLAPGMYYAVVYAASGRDVLFWGENIQAFQVHSRPNFGIAEYFEHLKGVVMPPYRVSLEKGASPS